MFDDEIKNLITRNADVIEIQSEVAAHAAKAILEALKERNKARVLNNITILQKALRKINEEFLELEFLVE